jgi:hypothetical protein
MCVETDAESRLGLHIIARSYRYRPHRSQAQQAAQGPALGHSQAGRLTKAQADALAEPQASALLTAIAWRIKEMLR